MANDAGTSVGTISLLLQIKANIEQQVSDMASRATQQAKEKFAKVGDDAGERMAKGVATSFNKSIEKQKIDISSLEKQLDNVREKMDGLIETFIENYRNPLWSDEDLDAAVEKFKSTDKAYTKLVDKEISLLDKLKNKREKFAVDMEAVRQKEIASAQEAAEEVQETESSTSESILSRFLTGSKNLVVNAFKITGKGIVGITKSYTNLIKSIISAPGKAFKFSLKSVWNLFLNFIKNIKRPLKSVFMLTAIYAAFKAFRTLLSSAIADSKKFTDSLNTVKANLLGAFTPIVSAVMPMLERLMSGLAAVTTRITSFIAGIFGKTYRQVMAKTKKLQSTASGSGKKGSLAGFDEINQLSSDAGSGTGGIDFDAISDKGDSAATKLGEKFAQAFTKIKEFLSPVTKAMSGMFDNAVLAFNSFISAVAPGMTSLWQNIFLPVLTWIRDGVASAFTFISDRFEATARFFTSRSEVIARAFEKVGNTANKLWTGFIRPVLDKLYNGIKETLSWIQTAFGGVIDFLLGVFTGDWKRMAHGLTTIILGMANAIISAFESIVNSAIDVVNGLISRIKNTGLGQWVSGIIDLKEITPMNVGRFTIPEFASGATINQPTLGLMGEYAGAYSNPEIVSPQSLMLETFMAAVEPLVASIRELIANSTMGQTIHIHLDASLSALARVLQPYLDDEAKRHGVKLVVET